MLEEQQKDTFQPEKLVGKRIFFQCQLQSIAPVILEIGHIVKHHKADKISFHMRERNDLVVFKLLNRNYNEHILDYKTINALIDNGVFKDNEGLEYRIL